MELIHVHGSNFMGLESADLAIPSGTRATRVGGDNSTGKTSFIRMVAYALSGKKRLGVQPVRRGAEQAEVGVELAATEEELANGCKYEMLTVERSLTADGREKLKLTSNDAKAMPTPQKILNGLLGPHWYDPMEFLAKPDKRIEILRQATKLDVTADVKEIAKLTEQRKTANVLARNLRERLRAAHAAVPPGAPTQKVDTAAVVVEMQAAAEHNRLTAEKQDERDEVSEAQEDRRAELATLTERTMVLEEQITAAQAVVNAWEPLEGTEDVGVFEQVLAEAEEKNSAFAKREAAKLMTTQLVTAEEDATIASDLIKISETKKSNAVKAAAERLGIPGLTLDSDDAGGICFNGTPIDDCSTTEQTVVSCAIQIAAHRELPLMFVPNAAYLMPENRAVIEQMAVEADVHVMLEVPGDDHATVEIIGGVAKQV